MLLFKAAGDVILDTAPPVRVSQRSLCCDETNSHTLIPTGLDGSRPATDPCHCLLPP